LEQPGIEQRLRLRAYLRGNALTAFGKAHGFEYIHNYEDFARRVPLADYDDLQPWIEGIRRGESNVLTQEAITHLVPTSGTSSARKLIPFTAGLQREFNAAIGPWLVDLFRQAPGVIGGSAYWSVTPVTDNFASGAIGERPLGWRSASRSEGQPQNPGAEVLTPLQPKGRAPISCAIPIGFDSDSAYLGGARKRLVDAIMAVPTAVQQAGSLEAFRYVTLLALLRCRELRLISVWHPSFLSLLLDALPSQWEKLLADVERGTLSCADGFRSERALRFLAKPLPERANELRAAGPLQPAMLWRELRVISCWGDGPAELAAADLRARFPNVLLQPKGLLATEAFVTLPFGAFQPLAIRSHFFEFIDAAGRVHLADSLREGAEYEVVITTGGGLWRYRLGDRVMVSGSVGKTPSLRFLGRSGNVSDRFGEKLSEVFVAEAMREVFGEDSPRPSFALLAPDEDGEGCRYTLYVEGRPQANLAEQVDQALRRSPGYDYCRGLGQLLPLRVFVIGAGGYESFAGRLASEGARLGDIKPAVLSRLSGWSNAFAGTYASVP